MHAPSDTRSNSLHDDAALLQASLRSPERFGELFDRHHAAVFRYVRSRVGMHADDVVGDTFLEAFRARTRFDAGRGRCCLPWLLGIATRMVDRRRELEQRWLRIDAAGAAATATATIEADSSDDIDRRLDDERLSPSLRRALGSLRRRDRVALLLHVAGDLSIEEVALALEIPPGTVKSRLHRARRILAAQLEVLR